jgi:flagellar biosynthesis protein FlhF
MNVKKFLANTSREAWRMVRDSLGPDAVILSNRTVDGQVEILALPLEDMASLAEPATEKSHFPQVPAVEPAPKGWPANAAAVHHFAKIEKTPANPFAGEKRFQRNPPPPAKSEPPATEPGTSSDLAGVMSNIRTEVMGEIRSMRGMLTEQLAEISWSGQQTRSPMKALVLREMLAAGFSPSLARYLAEKVPAGEKEGTVMNWIRSVLGRNIAVMDNEREILEKGGVYALVGPTGVGKTTTTAKLAARCVMRHGAGKLALITTDGYRIGAYEQLRIYGKILGVMVHSVKDETDLRIALEELKNKHTILIDTVGMGQRDKMVAEQVAMLSGVGTEVKRLLCLSATSTGETLNEVVRAYLGGGLAGCIMTKLDEAATIGNVLDVVIRRKLNLYYVANGQRVPEDLHMANQHYLVDRAFKLKRETAAFQLQDDELPLVMANAAHAMNDKSLREVNLG